MAISDRHIAAERSFVALLALYLQRSTKDFSQWTSLTRNASGNFTFAHSTTFTGASKTFELENRTGQPLLNGVSVYFPSREPLGSFPPDSAVTLDIPMHINVDYAPNGFTPLQAHNVAWEIGARLFNSPGTIAALSSGQVQLYDIGASNQAPVALSGFLTWHFQGQPRWSEVTEPSEGSAHLITTISASYRA